MLKFIKYTTISVLSFVCISSFCEFVYAEKNEGRSLFVRHCLECHSSGGMAEQIDFTTASRLIPVKDQLKLSIERNEMPPNQVENSNDCLKINSKTKIISPAEKLKIISWLDSLSEAEDMFLPTYQKINNLSSKNFSNTPKEYRELVFAAKDLVFLRKESMADDVYTYYELKNIKSDQPISVFGMTITHNNTGNLHHATLRYKNYQLGSVASWNKFLHKIEYLPEEYGIEINNSSPLILSAHYLFKNFNQLDDENITVKLFYKNQKGNARILNIAVPRASLNLNLNFSDHITYQFSNSTDNPIFFKSISPHMHRTGKEILVEKISAFAPVKNQCMAHIIGYNHNITQGYSLVKPMLLNSNEKIQITCQYKKTNKPFVIGMSAEDEMCTVLFLVNSSSKN